MTPGTHRFVVLDALRGLCALFVCLFHFHSSSALMWSGFVRASYQFVDFFFVLSGFVIAANYRQRLADGLSRWRFLALRLGRIYPLHVFVLALLVGFEVAAAVLHPAGVRPAFDATHSPAAIVLHLLMLHSVGLTSRLTWNDPSWSIATEFWAYVGFALIVPLARGRLDWLLAAIVVVCPLILLAVTPYGINVTYDWGLVRCVYGFALGVLCWAAWQRLEPTDGRWSTVAEIVVVTAVVAFIVAARASPWSVLGPLLFALAVLVFAGERGAVSRLLAVRPMLFLGTLSYSVYMMHSIVQARMTDVLKLVERKTGHPLTTTFDYHGTRMILAGSTPMQGVVLTMVMLIAVVATSYVTYRLIERPAQQWTRARLKRSM